MTRTLLILCLLAAPLYAAAPPCHDDPLPQGALARLGYARMVAGWGALQVSPDGRWAICGKQGFDLVEGRQRPMPVTIPDGYELCSLLGERTYVVDNTRDYILYDPMPRVLTPPRGRAERDRISFDTRRRFCLHVENDNGKVVRLADLSQQDSGKAWRTLAAIACESHPCLSADGSRVLWYDAKRSWLTVHDITIGKDFDIAKLNLGKVRAIALSPDGKTAVCASADHVAAYDTTTGKLTWRKKLARNEVGSEAMFTPDGKYVVLPHRGYHVVTAGANTSEAVYFREPAGGAGISYALLSDSKRIAVRDEYGVIRIRDLLTGKQLDRHSRFPAFAGVQFLSGHTAASWSPCGTFVVWDMRDGRMLSEAVLPQKDAEFVGAVFHPSGKHFLAWTDTETGLLAETTTGKILARCKRTTVGGAIAPTSQRSAFFSLDHGTMLHLSEQAQEKALRHIDSYFTMATFSPNGRNLLWANKLSVSMIEVASGKPRWEVYLPSIEGRHGNDLVLVALCKGGDRAVIVREEDFTVIDVGAGRRTAHTHFASSHVSVRPAAVSASGRWLAVLEPVGPLRVFDLEERDFTKAEIRHKSPGGWVKGLALDPDGSRLITAQGDGTCVVYDRVTLKRPDPVRRKADEWTLLAHLNPEDAQAAISTLLEDRPRAVKLLAAKLMPAAALSQESITKWVTDLAAEDFATRSAAERALATAADHAEEALLAIVDKPTSLEQKRRAERLLARLDLATNGELLRQMRAIEILERLGSKEALALLEKLAKGAPAARLTREAKESLTRRKAKDDR